MKNHITMCRGSQAVAVACGRNIACGSAETIIKYRNENFEDMQYKRRKYVSNAVENVKWKIRVKFT